MNSLPTWSALLAGVAIALAHVGVKAQPEAKKPHLHRQQQAYFNRVAVFPAYLNAAIDRESVAEIVAASEDGNTLVYTDGENQALGFVDITDAAHPVALGALALNGEPTSVAVKGRHALVAVNTSVDFINTSGELAVVDIASKTVVATHPLGGQPDAVAVSPDGRYAAVAIENERDEDLGDGAPPQLPAGFLVIVDLPGEPADWTLRTVALTGLAGLFTQDPEPEYVAINRHNVAAVTLQENNHIVLVNLADGSVRADFSAGTVDLEKIDTLEEKPALISLNAALQDVPREPDGATWLAENLLVTANEGDLNGGSRGISVFDSRGRVRYDSGNSLEHLAVRLGHYPDRRSGNKGNETENVLFARFGRDKLLFAGSERANLIYVYEIDGKMPRLLQALPAGVGPEGLLAIPQRNLFIAASEKDDRGDKFRSVLNIYHRARQAPAYPSLMSVDRSDATPIPWGALSGLAVDTEDDAVVYTIHDSFYQQSRIYRLNVAHQPALIDAEIALHDSMGKLAAVEPALVNADSSVNLDQEGIAAREKGGFWIAAEGDDAPLRIQNLLLRVAADGLIEQVVTLPSAVDARLRRFGFEGVAVSDSEFGEVLYVAFQREWQDDPAGLVRIGRYQVADNTWTFYYYPLDAPQSANGGWTGLSEIVSLGEDELAVIERDNQAGPDAAIKRIYRFSIGDITPLPDPGAGVVPAFPLLSKTLARDLLPDLRASGGLVLEKIEGLAVTSEGDALVINDNDGVDDSNGETRLIRIRQLFD